mmetsp:Transcript_48565/g.114558  ORF Transcript_48565/g.114558 Transcript_48565/m.114558 type:complete len:260 (+) Transcript_48565:84-863(+)
MMGRSRGCGCRSSGRPSLSSPSASRRWSRGRTCGTATTRARGKRRACGARERRTPFSAATPARWFWDTTQPPASAGRGTTRPPPTSGASRSRSPTRKSGRFLSRHTSMTRTSTHSSHTPSSSSSRGPSSPAPSRCSCGAPFRRASSSKPSGWCAPLPRTSRAPTPSAASPPAGACRHLRQRRRSGTIQARVGSAARSGPSGRSGSCTGWRGTSSRRGRSPRCSRSSFPRVRASPRRAGPRRAGSSVGQTDTSPPLKPRG